MITDADYFMGRDVEFADQLTRELRVNAGQTIARTNLLLSLFYAAYPSAEKRKVNSGWRPPEVNAATAGAAPKSNHMTCKAVDLSDADERLDDWCMMNLDVLERVGLWLEHPESTPRWCHLQTVPPGSGNRVFRVR